LDRTFLGAETNNDDFWAEDGPSGITPVDMDTGNPWDSSAEAPAAPVAAVAAFAAFEQSDAAAGSSEWAAFNDSEMTPVASEETSGQAAEPETEGSAVDEAQVPVEETPAAVNETA